jgi:demethoxyubiquinone hydroxylase (CLK1/Coq7/Cat5 family)
MFGFLPPFWAMVAGFVFGIGGSLLGARGSSR